MELTIQTHQEGEPLQEKEEEKGGKKRKNKNKNRETSKEE